jgi:arylsulfatase A-like enzyme
MPMTSRTSILEEASPTSSLDRDLAAYRWRPLAFLLLSAWCGLSSGLVEVVAIIVRKHFVDLNQLYWMSRHFIWLVPLTNLVVFLIVGVLLSLLVLISRGRGHWVATRLLGTLTLLPLFWASFPRVHAVASFVLALGLAMRLLVVLERHAAGVRRLVRASFPVVAAAAPFLAVSLWGLDRLSEWREASRPLPPAGSENVLLIVLDTVGAGHLGLYGYARPTSPTLDELAARGVRFDRAQATSSWTLPSHASMFTGRWPHELSCGWLTPVDRTFPTLAEFLGSRGFATAGFTGNCKYCASDSGLNRGFTVYRDYIFPNLTAFQMASLIDRAVNGLLEVELYLAGWLDIDLMRPLARNVGLLFKQDRKEARVVNLELLDWLSSRRQPERPFFAFLNFYDAHSRYQLPKGAIHRFGRKPSDDQGAELVKDWTWLMSRQPTEEQIALARDAYDDCVAYLDEQLGRLMDELERRGILDRAWVIITGDHGESFGEHIGVFRHGSSLYQTEVRVPLVIVPPVASRSQRVVAETVSLRDLPATIVNIVGLDADAPFPGETLARFWKGPSPPAAKRASNNQALAEVVPVDDFSPDTAQLLERRWPLAALIVDDWAYIRREGDVREELFHLGEDPGETRNLAGDPARKLAVGRMREALGRLTAGPLTPDRFNP